MQTVFACPLQVLLDKASVDKERARLATENADLRHILRQYLDGIAVNADVMNSPTNPLLVVNQRLQLVSLPGALCACLQTTSGRQTAEICGHWAAT